NSSSKDMDAVSVARFTEAFSTPSTFLSDFSTAETQLAQCMPSILRLFFVNVISLFIIQKLKNDCYGIQKFLFKLLNRYGYYVTGLLKRVIKLLLFYVLIPSINSRNLQLVACSPILLYISM